MALGCNNRNCYTSEGESCAVGYPKESQCPHWASDGSDHLSETTKPESERAAYKVPWSGSAFGNDDFINITPRGRSMLIGILGAENSGKTTFLVGCYLKLLIGSCIDNKAFSGSYTLGAWESLASWVRFDDDNHMSSFPPHTPRGADRVPGVLHLALKDVLHRQHRDVLLTDAPGEWFSSWSLNENTQDAEGARWIVKYSDAFIVFADSDKLSGAQRGQARKDLRQLIERLGNHAGNKPVYLFWAKGDKQPPETIMDAIRKTLRERIKNAHEVVISVEDSETLIKAMADVINGSWTPPLARQVFEPICQLSSFNTYRGHNEKS